MTPTFFRTQAAFRKWLQKNRKTKTELFVGYYKVGSGKPSITWSQSVDQALCFGWIDGVKNSMDKERYCIRFTPRKKKSIWSTINIKKVKVLTRAGLMMVAGRKAFDLRSEEKLNSYSHENAPVSLATEYTKLFKKNEHAWRYFEARSPSYRKQISFWIMNAKKEATRRSRLQKVIYESENQIN